jgi:hypothetical protein
MSLQLNFDLADWRNLQARKNNIFRPCSVAKTVLGSGKVQERRLANLGPASCWRTPRPARFSRVLRYRLALRLDRRSDCLKASEGPRDRSKALAD